MAARIQKKTRITAEVLSKNQRIGGKSGPCQPPGKGKTKSAEKAKALPYSAMKKSPQRMPLYSIIGPPRTSDSATGISNGGRNTSARAAIMKMRAPHGRHRT